MAFNTLEYGLFLLAALLLFWTMAKPGWRPARLWLLLAASYFFYGYADARYLLLIAAVTAVDFGAGLALERLAARGASGRARAVVALAAVANLSALGSFKYYGFAAENVSALLGLAGIEWTAKAAVFALPLGISFYAFQGLSYVIDVHRGRVRASHSLRDFALYISFFPHLAAGPIVRAEVLLPQFGRDPAGDRDAPCRGLFLIMRGLAKKVVIADFLAVILVDRVYSAPERASLPLAWLGVYGYALQIYCDFSGYTDIAIGSARLFGIELPANFNRPYLASSLRDFWRRWHLSLSSWLRDYLYVPLGGNRRGRPRMYLAIFITMLLGGLWHGAAWTFLAWGAYHGALLMADRWWEDRRAKAGVLQRDPSRAALLVKRAAVFHLVCLGWVLFRSADLSAALAMYGRLFTGSLELGRVPAKGVGLLALGYFLHFMPRSWGDRLEDLFVKTPAILQGVVLALALALFSLASNVSAPFIYFQF